MPVFSEMVTVAPPPSVRVYWVSISLPTATVAALSPTVAKIESKTNPYQLIGPLGPVFGNVGGLGVFMPPPCFITGGLPPALGIFILQPGHLTAVEGTIILQPGHLTFVAICYHLFWLKQ